MTTQADAARELPRVLGLADVVLLYAVAGMQWLSTAARAGTYLFAALPVLRAKRVARKA